MYIPQRFSSHLQYVATHPCESALIAAFEKWIYTHFGLKIDVEEVFSRFYATPGYAQHSMSASCPSCYPPFRLVPTTLSVR